MNEKSLGRTNWGLIRKSMHLVVAIGIATLVGTGGANAYQGKDGDDAAKGKATGKTDDAKGAAKSADGDPKAPQTKDAKATKKVEKPKRVPTRKEYIERPGAVRAPVKDFRISKPLTCPQPTKDQINRFDDMRKGKIPPEGALIDMVARHQVYAMTARNEEANVSKIVDDRVRELDNATRSPNDNVARFVPIYKRAVFKHLADLFDNSLVVETNAVLFVNRLNELPYDVKEGVPILVSVLEKKREDAVLYLAMQGLDLAKEKKILDVQPERDAVAAIMALADKNTLQPVLHEQAIVTLGKLGRAFIGQVAEKAEVATFLADNVNDPANSLRTRTQAAISLGSLRIDAINMFEKTLVANIIGNALKDLIAGQKEGKVPEEYFRWWVYNLARALHNFNKQSGNPDVQQMFDACTGIFTEIIQNKAAPEVGPLDEWLAKHKSFQKFKLAPLGVELKHKPNLK